MEESPKYRYPEQVYSKNEPMTEDSTYIKQGRFTWDAPDETENKGVDQ